MTMSKLVELPNDELKEKAKQLGAGVTMRRQLSKDAEEERERQLEAALATDEEEGKEEEESEEEEEEEEPAPTEPVPVLEPSQGSRRVVRPQASAQDRLAPAAARLATGSSHLVALGLRRNALGPNGVLPRVCSSRYDDCGRWKEYERRCILVRQVRGRSQPGWRPTPC